MGMEERDREDDHGRMEGEEGTSRGIKMKWQGQGRTKREKEGDKVLGEIRQKARNLSPATETKSRGGLNREGSESSGRLSVAELTYIDLTENNVYYAANHNQGVEHIPGIPKIALSEMERVVGESDVRSAQTRSLYSYNEFS